MLKRVFLLAILAIVPLMSSAQKMVTASGSYTYVVPKSESIEKAELTAIERAQIDAIENEFGRVIGVKNYTTVVNEGDQSSIDFLSLGESEVNGEWIETIGKPSIQHIFDNGQLVIRVSITGRIREVKTAKPIFDAKILRNGVADKYEDNEFKEGDDFYISFQAPTDGYVAVYLYDLSGVYRLLPLKFSSEPAFPVIGNKKYLFFANGVSLYNEVQNLNQNAIHSTYALTCNGPREVNRLYIIYSPNRFSKANDNEAGEAITPAYIDFEGFQKWFSRCKKRDRDLSWMIRDIEIKK